MNKTLKIGTYKPWFK